MVSYKWKKRANRPSRLVRFSYGSLEKYIENDATFLMNHRHNKTDGNVSFFWTVLKSNSNHLGVKAAKDHDKSLLLLLPWSGLP